MSTSELTPLLERQLLLQLGDRLKALRQAQGLGTVDMAARAGITRNTLRSIEAGDPGPSIGNVLKVMSVLGISADLALLAGDHGRWVAPGSAAARSSRAVPVVHVRVAVDERAHRREDLLSLALHEEAVRRVKADPGLRQQALDTAERWLARADARSAPLWREWQAILVAGAWRKVLGRARHAQQLRQTSPLVTVLPEGVRLSILAQMRALQQGVELGPSDAEALPEHKRGERTAPAASRLRRRS